MACLKREYRVINSRSEIVWLLKQYTLTEQEYIYQFWMSEEQEWDAKKQVAYANGVVLGRFREDDGLTMQVLKEGVTDKALLNEVKIYLTDRIDSINKMEHPDILQEKLIESYKRQREELSSDSIDNWIRKNCRWIRNDVIGRPYTEIRVLLFLYYSYENYNYQRKHLFCSDLNELNAVYENVLDKKSQFCKYGLVPIDDERELMPVEPPRIYDRVLDKTFFTKNVPMNLLKTISKMTHDGIVNDFSVRLINEQGYKGRLYCEYLAEALERGEIFQFVSLGNYSISKLYAKEYENCMWIVIDPQNITFEELCKDFEVYNDMVVTQVIHLQYEREEECAYITHLDHEYVFYTIDEYGNRMNHATQKGTAKTRLKSFKIDNSKIPFDYRCEVLRKDEKGRDLPQEDEQFLCYVLECYFKHKDLLKEYFQEIID